MSSWKKNECNEAETECKDTQKRKLRETERETEKERTIFISTVNVVVPTFLLFVAHSVSLNVHSGRK